MEEKHTGLNGENWREYYKDKIVTADEAVKAVKSGDKIVAQQTHMTAAGLLDALVRRAPELRDVEIFASTNIGRETFLLPEYKDSFKYRCIFLDGNSRDPYAEGRAQLVPCHYSMMPKYLEEVYKPNILFVTLSEPDENGLSSLSINVDFTRKCMEICDIVIGQINKYAPKTVGNEISLDDVTWIVEDSEPLPVLPEHTTLKPVEEAIGKNIAAFIHDGDCLQVGIGGIPDAVLACMYDKKDLGIHTEVFGDGVADLYEHGVITGKCKQIDKGKIVSNCVLGSRRAIDFCDNNPDVLIAPVDYTNDPVVIAKNDNVVSINAALQVDLFGQVAADTLNGRAFSGVGGQLDFVRGATMSKGGRSFITLPSTAKHGTISRIVPALPAGTPVTTSRYDIMYLVTEYGVVNLWGLSTRERAEAIIGLAHPDFREELTEAAKQMGLIL